MTTVHVVVPEGVDDPARPSGGNVYDRRVCGELAALGFVLHEHAVPGSWPRPDAAALAALARVVERLPDGAVVLLDGLVASPAAGVVVAHAERLRLVVLVHMPLGLHGGDGADDARSRERAVLSSATAVVTTSAWTRARLIELYGLPDGRLHVAEPAVDEAALAAGTAAGGELLCVAAVTPGKGHDVLLAALAATLDLGWSCVCVGSLDRDPAFVSALRRRSLAGGLDARVRFPGPRTGADLERSYAAADLLVLASRAETYGMVVGEALARGVPVLASDVGGVPESLGRGADGSRPGLLVPPGDPTALGAALRSWLGDARLRDRLRTAARERRGSLAGWPATAAVVAGVLAGAAR